jgi:hypothetical protein
MYLESVASVPITAVISEVKSPQDELRHAKQIDKCGNVFQSTPAARREGNEIILPTARPVFRELRIKLRHKFRMVGSQMYNIEHSNRNFRQNV